MRLRPSWVFPGLVVALVSCSTDGTSPDTTAGLAIAVAFSGDTQMAPDAGMIRVEGPTNRNVSIQPGQTVTIEGLLPGNYTVSLEGLRAGQLESFGETTVTVVAGQNRQATITLRSFIPPSVTAPPQIAPGQAFTVQIGTVQGANAYVLEYASNPNFTNSQTVNSANTAVSVTINTPGEYVFRARARNRFNTLSHASQPSAATEVRTPAAPPVVAAYQIQLRAGMAVCGVGFRDIQTIETVGYTDDGDFPTGSELAEAAPTPSIESWYRFQGETIWSRFYTAKAWQRGANDSGSSGSLTSGACWRLPDSNPQFVEHRVRIRDAGSNWSDYVTTRVNLPMTIAVSPNQGVSLGPNGTQQYTAVVRDHQNAVIEGDVVSWTNTNSPVMGGMTQQGLYTVAEGAQGVDNIFAWSGRAKYTGYIVGPNGGGNETWWASCFGIPLSNTAGNFHFYRMTVYQGVVYEFILRGNDQGTSSGDPDLYIRMGAKPTVTEHDAASVEDSYQESILWTAPSTGTVWIGIHAFTNFANVSFTSHTPVAGDCGFPGSGLIANEPGLVAMSRALAGTHGDVHTASGATYSTPWFIRPQHAMPTGAAAARGDLGEMVNDRGRGATAPPASSIGVRRH